MLTSELHFGCDLGSWLCREECLLLEAVSEHPGHQDGGEALPARVERLRGFVEAHPLHGDAVLCAFELHLKISKCGRGLQLRIALSDHEQP